MFKQTWHVYLTKEDWSQLEESGEVYHARNKDLSRARKANVLMENCFFTLQ